MKLNKVTLMISPNECNMIVDENLKIKRFTEKMIYVCIGGFEKEVKKEFLNKIEKNEQATNRNTEYYKNHTYCEDIEAGIDQLKKAYFRHVKASEKSIKQFNQYHKRSINIEKYKI